MTAVCKIAALLTITLALLAGAPSRGFCAAAGCEWPLELVNESGAEITSLRISQTGMEKWSENRAPSPIPDGGRAELDIERDSILGLCDVEITADGRAAVWRRLPILEIFSITVDKKFQPHYERIKLGA
ncbi:MAG TPA: hypothetical protein IAC22_05590 [Candidatus Caccocola faecipullorum]|nr:hypothetical protein [Candidatus Caccocola faecipullorum]